MRGNRTKLLQLLEQKPRFVRDLEKETGMRANAILEALREFRLLGVVKSQQSDGRGANGRPPKMYFIATVQRA